MIAVTVVVGAIQAFAWFRQNSGLEAWKAPDPVFPALGLRFETGLLLLSFLAEIGGEH